MEMYTPRVGTSKKGRVDVERLRAGGNPSDGCRPRVGIRLNPRSGDTNVSKDILDSNVGNRTSKV